MELFFLFTPTYPSDFRLQPLITTSLCYLESDDGEPHFFTRQTHFKDPESRHQPSEAPTPTLTCLLIQNSNISLASITPLICLLNPQITSLRPLFGLLTCHMCVRGFFFAPCSFRKQTAQVPYIQQHLSTSVNLRCTGLNMTPIERFKFGGFRNVMSFLARRKKGVFEEG